MMHMPKPSTKSVKGSPLRSIPAPKRKTLTLHKLHVFGHQPANCVQTSANTAEGRSQSTLPKSPAGRLYQRYTTPSPKQATIKNRNVNSLQTLQFIIAFSVWTP
jgi:hypothetical protein